MPDLIWEWLCLEVTHSGRTQVPFKLLFIAKRSREIPVIENEMPQNEKLFCMPKPIPFEIEPNLGLL